MSDKNPVWHIKNNVDRPYPVGARISYAPMGEPVGIINGPFMGIEPIYKPYYRRIVDKEALVQKFIYGTIESNIGPGQVRVWRGDDGWKWERPFDLDKAKSVNYQYVPNPTAPWIPTPGELHEAAKSLGLEVPEDCRFRNCENPATEDRGLCTKHRLAWI